MHRLAEVLSPESTGMINKTIAIVGGTEKIQLIEYSPVCYLNLCQEPAIRDTMKYRSRVSSGWRTDVPSPGMIRSGTVNDIITEQAEL